MPARDANGRFVANHQTGLKRVEHVALNAVAAPKPLPKFGAKMAIPYKTKASYSDFPRCCGINVINGFGGVNSEDFDKEIKEHKNKLDKRDYSIGGLVLLALNDNQVSRKVDAKTTWHDCLLNNGYVLMSKNTNPVHGNNSTVYLYGLGTGRTNDIASLEGVAVAR